MKVDELNQKILTFMVYCNRVDIMKKDTVVMFHTKDLIFNTSNDILSVIENVII